MQNKIHFGYPHARFYQKNKTSQKSPLPSKYAKKSFHIPLKIPLKIKIEYE